MTDLPYFTVEADIRAVLADAATDSNYDPELSPAVSATVTFTALVDDGDLLLATGASPRPTAYIPGPVVGLIDPADGRLKLRTSPDVGGSGTFAPVVLLGDSALLELAAPLHYRVQFSGVTVGGRASTIKPFTFQAPSTDGATVNLVSVARAPGQQATGITRIAPGGVRQDGFDVIFTFDGLDLPGSVSLEALAGPTGPTGATGATGVAATVSVGSVSDLPAGSTATVVNSGTSGAAVLDFGLVVGDTGGVGPTGAVGATGAAATITVGDVSTLAPGSTATVVNTGDSGAAVLAFGVPQGATGADATIAVGSVTTGAAGSTASVVNVGTPGAAVFNLTIPRGDRGEQGVQGVQGVQGIQGEAGVSLDINGTIATYGDLPGSPEPGDAYIVAADGKLYFFDGTSWPADGAGVPFVGPVGPQGVAGAQGITGPVGPDGQAATITVGTVTGGATAAVTNVGDSSSAVFDFTLPIGPTGDAATIAVGTVTSLDPGQTPTVTNSGTSGAAVFDFGVVTGSTGAQGATGDAATIAVGTVTTGDPGTQASVTNSGSSGAAVLDFTIPSGATGTAATVAVGTVTSGATASVTNSGTSSAAVFDFVLVTGATGAVGPVGATGAVGPAGDAATVTIGTVTTGDPGTTATATNVGTATDAIIDLTIPRGDTGSASSETWETLAGKPAVIAAGATEADARSAIDAEYTGNKGVANGYAELDGAGLVPQAQLPITTASWSTLDGKPAVVAAGATKADARSAIDAEYTGAKGQANGYASLDSNGRVPLAQLTLTAVDGGTPATAVFVDAIDGGTP